MKLFARIKNEKGKVGGVGGEHHLDIDIMVGNRLLSALTVRELGAETIHGQGGWGVYDKNDKLIDLIWDKKGKKQKGEWKAGPHGGLIDPETGYLKPYEDEHDE